MSREGKIREWEKQCDIIISTDTHIHKREREREKKWGVYEE